jgi:YggT family protein
MLIRILAFLLETLFFVLIAAALLRAWMNQVRVNMSGQPGSFVMALTDWLVKPLRRALPRSVAQSRLDWASVLAAVVLALVYAALWGVLFGVLLEPAFWGLGLLMLPAFAAKMVLRVALQTLFILVLGYAILSWIQPGSPAYALLARLTEPVLTPLRRVIPAIGGVDLSALVLLVLLQIGLMVLI